MTNDKTQRKERPMARGLLDYFPDALAEVANVSFVGNQQHNPGEEMHWSRGKSNDHADCVVRHILERGTIDDDGLRHSAKAAWRALAMLQIEIEDNRGEKADPSVDQALAIYNDPTNTVPNRYEVVAAAEEVYEAEQLAGFIDEKGMLQHHSVNVACWRPVQFPFTPVDGDVVPAHTLFNFSGGTDDGNVVPARITLGEDFKFSPAVGDPDGGNIENGHYDRSEPTTVDLHKPRKDIPAKGASYHVYEQLEGMGFSRSLDIAKGTTFTKNPLPGKAGPIFVYVAGPMRGIPNFNFPMFDKYRDLLLAQGVNVISPADIDRWAWAGDEAAGNTTVYVERDTQALMFLARHNPTGENAILLLPDWCHSIGAKAEFAMARWLKLKILDRNLESQTYEQADFELSRTI